MSGYGYVAAVVAVIVFAVMLYQPNGNSSNDGGSEPYRLNNNRFSMSPRRCLCHGAGDKVCPDTAKILAMYAKGELTEYSDLDALRGGPPRWNTPGNIF